MSNEIEQFIANNPNVSRETITKLTDFQSFLTEQNSKHNLVSRSQLDKIWMRHIHDSLRIFYLLDLNKSLQILDIGSGGGFPAIPLAVASEKYDLKYTLCESVTKKSNFLNLSVELLKLSNVEIINERVEKVKNRTFDIITCRAVSKLNNIFTNSHHLTKQNTIFLLHKGINVVEEINDATKCWFFEHELIKNDLEEGSFIVKINNLKKLN
jgi:16S rRNA (guanine527-N7)-methyltransferase